MSKASPETPLEPSREQIEQALLSAFPDRVSLATMVYFKFGINLDTISVDSNLPAIVSRLMIWAEERSCLAEVVKRGAERNPDNQELRKVAEQFKQLESPPSPEPEPTASRVNLLPTIGTRLKDDDLAATREFLYKGHPWLGRLLTLRPWKIAALFSILAILFLLIPAKLIGIHLMTRSDGVWVGFWQRPSWSVMYPIILPLIFAGTVWLSNYMRAVIETLVHKRVKVITKNDGGEATDYEQAFSNRLGAMARPLWFTIVLLTLAIMFFDTRQMWSGYIRHYAGEAHQFGGMDWSVAFIEKPFTFHSRVPTPTENLLFDVVAYSFEAAAIFLGLFWVAKFWVYLKVFSDSMNPDEPPYRFNPLVYDPYKRLGLYPMGRLFNGFLLIVVAFQVYVFWHRLEQMTLFNTSSSLNFWQKIISPLNPFNLLNPSSYFGILDPGMKMLLGFNTVPVLVVSYFSLLTLRRYVLEQRERASLEHGRELDEARKAGNHARTRMLEEKIDLLKDASVWPNGDLTAKRFLFIMIALIFTALLPPLLLYFVAAGLILEIWRSLTRSLRVPAG